MKFKSGLVCALASLVMLTSVDAFAKLCSGRDPAPVGGGEIEYNSPNSKTAPTGKGFYDCTLIKTEKQCKNSYGTLNKSIFKGDAAPGSTAYKCRWDGAKCGYQDKKCENGNTQTLKSNPFK